MIENRSGNTDRQLFLEKHHGKRLAVFDSIGIPSGWVVNARLPDEVKALIKADAFSIMPGGLNLVARRAANIYVKEVSRKYGENVVMLVLPDEETECGLSARFVLPADLKKSGEKIIDEAGQALEAGDLYLAEMKRCAYMAVTRHVDTK